MCGDGVDGVGAGGGVGDVAQIFIWAEIYKQNLFEYIELCRLCSRCDGTELGSDVKLITEIKRKLASFNEKSLIDKRDYVCLFNIILFINFTLCMNLA